MFYVTMPPKVLTLVMCWLRPIRLFDVINRSCFLIGSRLFVFFFSSSFFLLRIDWPRCFVALCPHWAEGEGRAYRHSHSSERIKEGGRRESKNETEKSTAVQTETAGNSLLLYCLSYWYVSKLQCRLCKVKPSYRTGSRNNLHTHVKTVRLFN